MKNNYAVITGASQGLGLYIAKELASRNYNLILVSLPYENLESVSKNISDEYNVTVDFFETDLTNTDEVLSFCNNIKDYNISVLVNNAGIGGSKKILDASAEYLIKIIDLNVKAPSILTRLLLPQLEKNTKSYILNVSSMAAFSPIGYKTVYPASKKFIDFFSLGLKEELKDKNVFVSAVYPGPMKTNAEVSQRIEKQSKFVNSGVIDLETMAYKSVEGMLKGKKRIVLGKLNKFSQILLSVLPVSVKTRMLSNAIKREIS